MSTVFYNIAIEDMRKDFSPADPLPQLPEIPEGSLVVVHGTAPLWRYTQAFYLLQKSQAGAIATHDPLFGTVVVSSRIPEYKEGDTIDIEPPKTSVKDQDNKFDLTIITRQKDDVVINQIKGSEGPVWPALIAQILCPPAEGRVWWLEVERVDNGYRISTLLPSQGKQPRERCLMYLTSSQQLHIPIENLSGLL